MKVQEQSAKQGKTMNQGLPMRGKASAAEQRRWPRGRHQPPPQLILDKWQQGEST